MQYHNKMILPILASLCLFGVSLSTARELYQYVGCYRDTGNRDLNTAYVYERSHLTVEFCYNFCNEKGTRYFAMQNGYYCSCGDSYGQYGKSAGCNVNCVGNAQQKCGGPWANSLYQIIPQDVDYLYLGCYRDTGNRDLNVAYVYEREDLTMELCYDFCLEKGTTYYAMQNGYYCSCGNDFGKYGTSAGCNVPCIGNPQQKCGGPWANSLYQRFGNNRLSGGGGGDDCEAAVTLQARVDELEAALAAAEAAKAAAEAEANKAKNALKTCRDNNARLEKELEAATAAGPEPVMPTASPTATLSDTAHKFTLPLNGIEYILETTPHHVALKADDFCEQYGMKLAQVENDETLAALALQFKAIQDGGTTLTEVATGERSAVNLDRDVSTEAFNAAGWSCVTAVPDGSTFKLVSRKCQGERAILCSAVPLYC